VESSFPEALLSELPAFNNFPENFTSLTKLPCRVRIEQTIKETYIDEGLTDLLYWFIQVFRVLERGDMRVHSYEGSQNEALNEVL
jgi:hypothetical protein